MAFTSPIDLSPQTAKARYRLIRRDDSPIWMVGYEECLPQYEVHRPRGAQTWTVEFVVRGEGEATTRLERFPLHTGTVLVYGPEDPVTLSADGEPMLKYFISALDPDAWKTSWFRKISPARCHQIPGALSGLALLEQVLEPLSPLGTDQEAAVTSLLEGFGAWLLTASRQPRGTPGSEVLERAFRILEDRFRELPNVEAWASKIGVSPNHLCRLFRAHHCKTPYAELTDRKLQHAYQELSRTAATVQEIARGVGYDDPFHFSRLFKRRMGFPPSHLR